MGGLPDETPGDPVDPPDPPDEEMDDDPQFQPKVPRLIGPDNPSDSAINTQLKYNLRGYNTIPANNNQLYQLQTPSVIEIISNQLIN